MTTTTMMMKLPVPKKVAFLSFLTYTELLNSSSFFIVCLSSYSFTAAINALLKKLATYRYILQYTVP